VKELYPKWADTVGGWSAVLQIHTYLECVVHNTCMYKTVYSME